MPVIAAPNSRKIFNTLRLRRTLTPDFHELTQYDGHIVFIYDNLMSKFKSNGYFLKNAKFLGNALTLSSSFLLKKADNTPVAFENKNSTARLKIMGEIYYIDLETLLKLDIIHSNTLMKKRRKEIVVAIDQMSPYKNGMIRPSPEVFMYVGIEEAWENRAMSHASQTFHNGQTVWKWRQDHNYNVH